MNKPVFLLAALFASTTLVSQAQLPPAAQALRARAAAGASAPRHVAVDCAKGETIASALEKGKNAEALEIVVSGGCKELPTIAHDFVTLRGADSSARLTGLITVNNAIGVVIRDFHVQGGDNHPQTGEFAGINVLGGSAVSIENVTVENILTRGIQSIQSFLSLRNVTVLRAAGGAYTFRSSGVILKDTVIGNNSPFGMSVINSGVTADGADLTFNSNLFGLIVQINSGFEHIVGRLTANNNRLFGILVAGQGIMAVGTHVEVKNNSGVGILVDELSSYTPLLGVPGGGPSHTITGNLGAGVSVERGSTFELAQSTVITGNQAGIRGDNSVVRLADTFIHDNAGGNLSLAFGARGEFGAANDIGGPIACDSTVITRGTLGCGSSATVSAGVASAAPQGSR